MHNNRHDPADLWEILQTSGVVTHSVSEIFADLYLSRLSPDGHCRRVGELAQHRIGDVFETIDERYGVLCELGKGAFGRVDQAWDPKHKRSVAIKRPLNTFDDDDRRYVGQI